MRRIALFVLFLSLTCFAQEESAVEEQSIPAEEDFAPVQENSLAPVQENSITEEVKEVVPETETAESQKVVEVDVPAEPVPVEEPVSEVPVEQVAVEAPLVEDVPAPTPAAKKKGGLLEGLLPVSPDEAIAKGRIYGGVSLSLIQGNTEDDPLNVLIGDVYDAYGYTFTIEAFGGYFIKDAMALGLRAGYSRTWFDVDFALLEDLVDLSERRKYVSNGFFIQPLLKNYLKVFDSRTIYFFNETSISVEYSYGMSQTDDGEDMKKTLNHAWSIDVGINPGICIMVLDRFAFETSVGLLGLNSSVIEVEENGVKKSQFVYNIVNFTVNLLALNFSIVTFF